MAAALEGWYVSNYLYTSFLCMYGPYSMGVCTLALVDMFAVAINI